MAGEAPNTLLSTSTLRILDLLCEGPIKGFVVKNPNPIFSGDPLMATYYDDVPVRNLDGSYNFNVSGQGYSFSYTSGTSGQAPVTGFDKVENIIPLSSNTRIANPPTGAGPYKTVVASFNTDTYPDANSVNVTVRVPALYSQDTQGNTNPYTITYAVDISVNNGPFVQFGGGDFVIQGKCTTPYLQTKSFTLPKTTPASSFYQWKVRVRRVSFNILSITTANEIFVDTISVASASSYSYPNSVLVGTQIAADQFSAVPSRAYEIDGMLVNVPSGYTPASFSGDGSLISGATYPNIWLGNFTSGVWTNNPAWVFYDILTNKTHGLGNYILPEWVDKWTLYQISQYCDTLVDNGAGGLEPMFTCNVSIQQADAAYNVLLNLASTFRGMLYYANGTIHMSQTSDKSPVYIYTNANVLDGGFSYSDTAKNTRSTVASVKWIDPNNGYRENVEYVEDTDGILRYGYIEKQMTAFACTSQGQAHRFGAWTLQSERLLTETVTFQTSLEGLYIRPGDVFGVHDNFRNNNSMGGRVLGFNATRDQIVVDRPIAIQAGLTYVLSAVIPKYTLEATGDVTGSDQISFIRNSQIESALVTTPAIGSTGIITVNAAFSSGLYVGTPWVLSASGNFTGANVLSQASFYTCLATAEVEPGKIEVLGLQANTGINFAINTGYSSSSNPVNSGDFTSILPPTGLAISSVTGLITSKGLFYTSFLVGWTGSLSTNLAYYIVSGAYPNAPFTGYTTTNKTGFYFPNSQTGVYNFKVGAVSDGGVYSAFLSGTGFVSAANPLGTMTLSGVIIEDGYDPLYYNSGLAKYTGYIGSRPTFHWDIPLTSAGLQIPQAFFVTGYRLRFLSLDSLTNYISGNGAIYISGANSLHYNVPDSFLYSGFTGGLHRSFNLVVDTMDTYGNITSGASLKVDNPPPRQIVSSGLAAVGGVGTFTYDIQPAPESELSGVLFWYSTGTTGLHQYPTNYDRLSNLTAGSINTIILTGNPYYVWFSLVDNFSPSGCAVYGPTPVAQLSGAGGGGGATLSSASAYGVSVPYNLSNTTVVSLAKTVVGNVAITADVTIYNNNYAGNADCWIYIYRGVTQISSQYLSNITLGGSSLAHFNFTDTIGAGTYTYTVQAAGNSQNYPPSNNDETADATLNLFG
jgi:hypothetical protein